MRYYFIYLVAIVNLINVAHLGLYMVGANGYDIQKFKRSHKQAIALSKKKSKKNNYKPLVSVLVPAHNEAKVIKRTLDSIMASTYDNIEVIVINDGSIDKTARIVEDYIKKAQRNPKFRVATFITKDGHTNTKSRRYIQTKIGATPIYLINQANKGKAEALNNALRNKAKGQFVMCLDADSMIHPNAVELAISYFKDHRVIGVAAHVRIIKANTVIGMVQRFEHMIGYRSKKFYSLTNSEFIIGGVASTYRRTALKKANFYDSDTLTEDIGLSLKLVATHGNRKKRIVYAADVIAMTEGVQTFNALLKQRYRWKMGNLQNIFKYRRLIGNYDPRLYSRMLTMYRLPMAIVSEVILILEPLLYVSIIYLSISYHSVGIVLGAYLTITTYTLWVLWPEEQMTNREKLRTSVSALFIYPLFFIMDIVQLHAVYSCIKNYTKIINRDKTKSAVTWVSAERSGKFANF